MDGVYDLWNVERGNSIDIVASEADA